MGAPDAADRARADAASLGHHRAGPMGGFARRVLLGQRHDTLGHLRPKRRDARRPRLVAQQTLDTVRHEPFLPAPDTGLGLSRPTHDLVRAKTLSSQNDDLGSPSMFLRRVTVLHNRPQLLALRRLHRDRYSRSHPPNSHARPYLGIPIPDSNVRCHPLSCPPLQDAGESIRGFPGSFAFRLCRARQGGAVVETTVDHTLMRGSEPHDR